MSYDPRLGPLCDECGCPSSAHKLRSDGTTYCATYTCGCSGWASESITTSDEELAAFVAEMHPR